MFEKMFAVITTSIMGLNILMLLIDEQIRVFPYILGIDIRYLITIGMMGFLAVTSLVRRFRQLLILWVILCAVLIVDVAIVYLRELISEFFASHFPSSDSGFDADNAIDELRSGEPNNYRPRFMMSEWGALDILSTRP